MDTFDLYFAAVASIRFHPANVKPFFTEEDIRCELELARRIVDLMMEVRECRLSPQ